MKKVELARFWAKEVDGKTIYESRGFSRDTLYSNEFPESYEIKLTLIPQTDDLRGRQPDMILYWEEGNRHRSR
jgi:hypothetical protein